MPHKETVYLGAPPGEELYRLHSGMVAQLDTIPPTSNLRYIYGMCCCHSNKKIKYWEVSVICCYIQHVHLRVFWDLKVDVIRHTSTMKSL